MSEIALGTNIAAAKEGPVNPPSPPAKKKTSEDVHMVRMSRNNPRVHGDYNYVDVMESKDSKTAKLEMWIAKALGTRLANTYPNRQWGVSVNTEGGTVIILCPSLSTEKGYFLHMKNYNLRRLEERAVIAAGEILERHGLSRNRHFDADILETLDRDIKDQVIATDSAPDPLQ